MPTREVCGISMGRGCRISMCGAGRGSHKHSAFHLLFWLALITWPNMLILAGQGAWRMMPSVGGGHDHEQCTEHVSLVGGRLSTPSSCSRSGGNMFGNIGARFSLEEGFASESVFAVPVVCED